MTVTGPAALTGREAPVWWRTGWYPCRVGVFCLEDEQGRESPARCADALDGGYPLLTGPYDLPAGLFANVNERS